LILPLKSADPRDFVHIDVHIGGGMNLWRRGSRFTFQKRVPSDLVPVLGATPIRVILPRCGRRQAERLAALLGGSAEATFQQLRLGMRDTEEDPRDVVIRELREYLREAEHALATSEKLRHMQVEHVERVCLMERLEEQQDMHERLQRLHAPMKEIQEGLRRIRQKRLEGEAAATAAKETASVLAQVQEHLALLKPGATDPVLPLFSEDFPKYVARQRKQLATDLEPEGSKYAKYTVPRAGKAFLEVIGDRPLMEYRPQDLEEFAFVLAGVPANHAKLQRFARLSLREAAAANKGLDKPYRTLAGETIRRQYLAPIKYGFEWMCNQHRVISPLATARLPVPKAARASQDRHPISPKQAADLFALARERARPDERWLPVLGYVTGCRLAELVFLQGRDLKWNKQARAWTFDLHDKVLIGRREVQRPLKTKGSRRIIALPHFLKEVGFIKWARERPGFIFDFLHRTKNPAGAASKRMMKMLRACGIDSEGEVFHSLRHSHKDWLRDEGIKERIIDLQSGHALEGVARKYGAKSLRPKDVRELAACELPAKLRKLIEAKKRRRG